MLVLRLTDLFMGLLILHMNNSSLTRVLANVEVLN